MNNKNNYEQQLLSKADKLISECRKAPNYTVLTDGDWICFKALCDDVLLLRYDKTEYDQLKKMCDLYKQISSGQEYITL